MTMITPCPFCNRMVENCCEKRKNAVPCEFCGKIIRDCCIERIWNDASNELEAGTFTQDKMDKLMFVSIEKEGGFKDVEKDEVIDPLNQPLKVISYQCPRCTEIGTFTEITNHIPVKHTDKDGVYE